MNRVRDRAGASTLRRGLHVLLATAALVAAHAVSAQDIYYLMVFNNPIAGREDEYNRWYDSEHGPEVAANPGVTGGQRYIAVPAPTARFQNPPRKYLVMYRISSDDLAATYAGFRRFARDPAKPADPLDPATSFTMTYEMLGNAIVGDGPHAFHGGELRTYEIFDFTAPATGDEAQFTSWYDARLGVKARHVPGIVAIERLARSLVQRDKAQSSPTYLIVYQAATDDVSSLLASLDARLGSASGDAKGDAAPPLRYVYRTLGPAIPHREGTP
jgi:hypothetical protein